MRLTGLMSGVVVSLALATGEGRSAEPLGTPIRPTQGPGYGAAYGGQMPYMPGAPHAAQPYYCPPPPLPFGMPGAHMPPPARSVTPVPQPPPQAKPPHPELPPPKPVPDATKPKEGDKPDDATERERRQREQEQQRQQQQQQQQPSQNGAGDLASGSGMSQPLSSGTPGASPGMYGGLADISAPGATGPSGTAPGMIGPAITYSATRLIHAQFLGDGTIFPLTYAGAPVASRSQFRIADNESPQPQDRIFLTYNFVHNVNKDALTKVPENAFIRDNTLISNLDVHYETFGFEKSFFCNYASIGLRVPFFQLQQEEPTSSEGQIFQIQRGLDQNTIGDVSVVLKTVLAYDCNTNNLISGGLVITAPTSPDVKVYNAHEPAFDQVGRSIRTTIVQPWLGTFLDLGHVYVHGFSSVAVPLHSDDVLVWFSDIGVGWLCTPWLVPTLELHYQTPINEASDMYREPVGVVKSLIVTAGAHFAFIEASTFTLGVATPLTGPGPFDVEAIAQLNIRF